MRGWVVYRGQWAIVAPGRYIGRPAILSQPSRGAGGVGGAKGAGAGEAAGGGTGDITCYQPAILSQPSRGAQGARGAGEILADLLSHLNPAEEHGGHVEQGQEKEQEEMYWQTCYRPAILSKPSRGLLLSHPTTCRWLAG